jgi:tRNA(Arg) A34 adenosine deaminase TadA
MDVVAGGGRERGSGHSRRNAMRATAAPVLSECPVLSGPELICLELAWEAAANGSNPVGAVLLDAAGRVVVRARSRIRENWAPLPQLAANRLAHAEINVVAQLQRTVVLAHHTLLTSLEPCPQCAAVLRQSGIPRLVYLGRDGWGGAACELLKPVSRPPLPALAVAGPREDVVGAFASALPVADHLRQDPNSDYAAFHREREPLLYGHAQAVLRAGWLERATAGEELPLAELQEVLA